MTCLITEVQCYPPVCICSIYNMRFSFSHNRCCRCLGASKQWYSFGTRLKCMLSLPERVTRNFWKCLGYMPQNLRLDPKECRLYLQYTHVLWAFNKINGKFWVRLWWGATESRRRTQGNQGTGKLFLSTAHHKKLSLSCWKYWDQTRLHVLLQAKK